MRNLRRRIRARLPRRPRSRVQRNVEGTMTVGHSLRIRTDQFPVQITVRKGGTLILGDRVFLNQGVNILATTRVVIGDDCKVADLAAIRDCDTHEVEPGVAPRAAPVVIGRNVWIGRGAVIMPGVTIGDHSVIAACAVVTGDLPDRCVAVGAPARVARTFEAPEGWVRR